MAQKKCSSKAIAQRTWAITASTLLWSTVDTPLDRLDQMSGRLGAVCMSMGWWVPRKESLSLRNNITSVLTGLGSGTVWSTSELIGPARYTASQTRLKCQMQSLQVKVIHLWAVTTVRGTKVVEVTVTRSWTNLLITSCQWALQVERNNSEQVKWRPVVA